MDLFEFYDQQPQFLLALNQVWEDKMASEGLDYEDCADWLDEVNALGFTFDYGLDAEPYGLRKMTDEELITFKNS